MKSGILVLGTDTAVGKTVVSTLLIGALRARGMQVAAFKPVETGCVPDPLDALALRAATGLDDPLDTVCPYRFALPAAPEAAAQAEDTVVDLEKLQQCFSLLAGDDRYVLAEGAGGAGTPYARGTLGLDLARLLSIPVLLVARAVLGTVSQTLLALRGIHQAGARCAGVVLNRVPGLEKGPEDHTNVPLIEAHSGIVPVLGTLETFPVPLPHRGSAEDVRGWMKANQQRFDESVDVDRLLDVTTTWG
jgi:dethiobiotin synthetase